MTRSKKTIFMTRTVPLAVFRSLARNLQQQYPKESFHLIAQESLAGDSFEGFESPYFLVPDGPFSFDERGQQLAAAIRQTPPDLFIIAANHPEFKGYAAWIDFAVLCGAKRIELLTEGGAKKVIVPAFYRPGSNLARCVQPVFEGVIFAAAAFFFYLADLFFVRPLGQRFSNEMSETREAIPTVTLFVRDYPLAISSPIVHTIEFLLEKGFRIELFLCNVLLDRFPFKLRHEQLRVVDLTREVAALKKEKRGIAPMLVHYLESSIKTPLFQDSLVASFWFRFFSDYGFTSRILAETIASLKKQKNDFAWIAFDRGGLNTAAELRRFSGEKTRLLYHSLELSEYPTFFRKLEKVFESENIPEISDLLIQDEDRLEVFKKKHPRLSAPAFLIPCGSRGPAVSRKSDFLKKKFSIPENKKIALYTGGIGEWAMLQEIAQSVASWPEHWVLVIHGFLSGPAGYLETLKSVAAKIPGRVFLSLDFISETELESMLASADVGIGFYREKDANFRLIGSASAKFSKYLRFGLPLLSNDVPSARHLFETFSCGLTAATPEAISQKIQKLEGNYEVYRKKSFECYETKFNFDSYYEVLLEQLSPKKEGVYSCT